ncbi:hypothetical protein [Synechococcus sp. MIT S9504]
MTEKVFRTLAEKIEILSKKLESLSNRDYLGRQRLLLKLHELRQRVDDDSSPKFSVYG